MNEFISVLLSLRIDYNLISAEYFKQWCTNAGFICGLLFVLIFIPMFLYSYKVAAKRFKKLHCDEKVIYIIKNSPFFMFITLYIVGFFFGYFILPFICFKNVPSIEHITELTWMGYLAAFLFLMCFIAIRFNIIYVLSNKRIELVSGFFLFNRLYVKTSFEYKNIEEAESEAWFCLECLYIKFKDGKYFNGILGFSNLKQAAKLINECVNKGGC